MSGAATLAALLARLAPPPLVLDLGLPAGWMFPWVPGAGCGAADVAALPAAERALLAGFRQSAGGRRLFGFDAATDAALLARAPAAWGRAAAGNADILVCLPGPPPPLLAPLWRNGAWGLLRAEGQPGWLSPERGRIMLLVGGPGGVEHYDLVLPQDCLPPLLEALHAAAEALAAAAGGDWQIGRRLVSTRLASLAVLRRDKARQALLLPAAALLQDGPAALEDGALPLGASPRLRLLLGCLPAGPATLAVRLQGGTAPALFLGGQRLAASLRDGPDGTLRLEARVQLAGAAAQVVGLARLPGAAPRLLGLEVSW